MSAARADAENPVAPARWEPSNHALQHCLALQAEAAPLSVLARLFGVDPLARDARRFYSGALAELALADSFAALGSEWTVVHSVPVGTASPRRHPAIDHLLIGPAGIFSVTAHSHAGQAIWVGERTFMVDDERLDHLATADEAAAAASGLLTAALALRGSAAELVVTPCIVVDSPATLQIRQRPGRIQVTTTRTFTAWLASLPRLFSPVVVDTLSAVALQSSTWPTALAADSAADNKDAHRRRDEFDRLRLHIASARLRRLIWTGLGVVASYTAVILSLTGETALQLASALAG
ncbi:nuclease-related domain-containing protein [Lacisediminihabitans sp. FW035]